MSSFDNHDKKNYSVNSPTDNNQNEDEDSVRLLAYTPKEKTQSPEMGRNGNAHTGTLKNYVTVNILGPVVQN